MPPKRALRRTASSTTQLSGFHRQLLEDVAKMEAELTESRTPFSQVIRDQTLGWTADVVLGQMRDLHLHMYGSTPREAEQFALELLKPPTECPDVVVGMRTTAVVQWSFEEASFWRGLPDNQRVLRFAKSIISTRFREDCAIASRTLSLRPKDGSDFVLFQLHFGDGSARGVAACVVYMLVLRRLQEVPAMDPQVETMIMSLLRIPTNFELHGDGSAKALLVAQAARQNQHAQVLPVNTLEWIGMIMQFSGLSFGSQQARTVLLKNMEQMVGAYNELPDVEAYTDEPLAKRARRASKAQVPAEVEDGQDKGLKIGNRRVMAMRLFISGGHRTEQTHPHTSLLSV